MQLKEEEEMKTDEFKNKLFLSNFGEDAIKKCIVALLKSEKFLSELRTTTKYKNRDVFKFYGYKVHILKASYFEPHYGFLAIDFKLEVPNTVGMELVQDTFSYKFKLYKGINKVDLYDSNIKENYELEITEPVIEFKETLVIEPKSLKDLFKDEDDNSRLGKIFKILNTNNSDNSLNN